MESISAFRRSQRDGVLSWLTLREVLVLIGLVLVLAAGRAIENARAGGDPAAPDHARALQRATAAPN